MLLECDRYNYVSPGWACGGTDLVLFAYDKTTGEQLAAELRSADGAQQTCLGGPASIEAVGHCTAVFHCSPNDAGVEAGRCADAAGD
jgi:hypothetical protein